MAERGRRARWLFVAAFLMVALPACRSASSTPDCTAELGILIEPRHVELHAGEPAFVHVETSTCGGSIKRIPRDLTWSVDDPTVARVESAHIIGTRPGRTRVVITSDEYGELGMVDVLVVSG